MPDPSPSAPRIFLLAVAAAAEARAALVAFDAHPAQLPPQWTLLPLPDHFDLVITGIGKSNAAAAVARTLDPSRHAGVLCLGVAGALPRSGLSIASVVAASASVYADEGLQTPDSFLDCAAMGFPIGPFTGSSIPAAEPLLGLLRPLADAVGPIATVSTCSGTDALAHQVRDRTGALAEAMEGAAVAHVAAVLSVPAAELRVISNTTGRRDAQAWDLPAALSTLTRVIGRLRRLPR